MNWGAVIATILLCFAIFVLGGKFVASKWQKAAIEQGCAQYNQQTGDFEWLK